MRAISRQDLCHARVSIVRLVQWSLRRARSCCTFVLFVQATSLFMCAPFRPWRHHSAWCLCDFSEQGWSSCMKDHHCFSAATTDVIIVCRWRAPSVGHGSRLKVVACRHILEIHAYRRVDDSKYRTIPPRPSGWAVRPVDAFLKVTINKRS